MQQLENWQIRGCGGLFYRSLLLLMFIAVLAGCGENESAETQTVQKNIESFTFFDLGRNTIFSERTRKNLQDRLGRDAIAGRSTIDLKINYNAFLKEHFPELHELNRKLNDPPGARIEHNIKKLMYRYIQKKAAPFDYVELVFSGYAETPLLFDIRFRKDDANIVKTLETKYGRPEIIIWENESGRSMYWTKYGDYLIVSSIPDQFGDYRYRIMIYFTENLKQLIETEQNEREKKERELTEAGKTAF
jgi:hypothetical protein